METVWFCLVAFMITAYVVLDGFDLGAGVLHLFIGRTDQDRGLILRTIGPVWDGNEVWLIAAGGTLFFAFPLLYASSFSGFYLPLHMVLWLLVLRAIGIEFRMHLEMPVWRTFFDGTFALSSTLLAIVFGVALGNVVRGVPLGPNGFFFAPLWTNWRVGSEPGILDWYTVLIGLLALVTLTVHGAHYVALKTTGNVQLRAAKTSPMLLPVLLVFTVLSLAATLRIQPAVLNNYRAHFIGYTIPAIVVMALIAMRFAYARADFKTAFFASSGYIVAMLSGAAFALYPQVLPSSSPGIEPLTIANTAAGPYSLRFGVIWWTFGMLLAIGYFVFVYRMFRGKVTTVGEDHSY
jgi:cytochrome d ubiquinol oxidase subunit II